MFVFGIPSQNIEYLCLVVVSSAVFYCQFFSGSSTESQDRVIQFSICDTEFAIDDSELD